MFTFFLLFFHSFFPIFLMNSQPDRLSSPTDRAIHGRPGCPLSYTDGFMNEIMRCTYLLHTSTIVIYSSCSPPLSHLPSPFTRSFSSIETKRSSVFQGRQSERRQEDEVCLREGKYTASCNGFFRKNGETEIVRCWWTWRKVIGKLLDQAQNEGFQTCWNRNKSPLSLLGWSKRKKMTDDL